MEVVCLILGPTLTSQFCSHTFWVLTSLHLFPILLKMFFITYKDSTLPSTVNWTGRENGKNFQNRNEEINIDTTLQECHLVS